MNEVSFTRYWILNPYVLLIKFIHNFGNLGSYSKPCYIKRIGGYRFSSVQLLNRVRLFATPWTAECQAYLSDANSRRLLKLMSIESVMPSNYLILCRLHLLSSIFPSIRVFSSESALSITWPVSWSFSISWFPLGLTGLILQLDTVYVFCTQLVCVNFSLVSFRARFDEYS